MVEIVTDVFRRLFNRSCQVALWMSAASCIALGVAGERVLGIWTHGKVAMDWPLYTLLLLSAAANAVWYTALMAAYATNRHVRVALVYSAVYGGGAFVFAYIFAKIFRSCGCGLGVIAERDCNGTLCIDENISTDWRVLGHG